MGQRTQDGRAETGEHGHLRPSDSLSFPRPAALETLKQHRLKRSAPCHPNIGLISQNPSEARRTNTTQTEVIYHNLPTDLTEKALETVNICRRTDVFVSIYSCNHAIRIHACAVLIYTVNAAAASTITTDFSSVTNQSSRDSTHRNDRSVIIYFQTCSSFFLQLSTKEDVLKDVGNQTVDGSH